MPNRTVVPAARPEWLPQTVERWEQFWRSDMAALVVDTDEAAVYRLHDLRDERDRTLAGFRGERVVTGSKGQAVISPLGRHLLALEAAILALEDRFGGSLQSRLRLGVKLGEAHRSLSELNRRLADAAQERPDPRATA